MNATDTTPREPRKLLHISNTDISTDSRILKELNVVSGLPDTTVFAIGVPDNSAAGGGSHGDFEYVRKTLFCRKLTALPRAVRYFFEMFEFTFRALRSAVTIRPAVVHCHDTFALPAGLLTKVFFGSTLVYDAHELESDKKGQNAILSYSTLAIEKLSWRKVDLFISVSDAIIDWYMKKLGPKDHILILNSPEISRSVPGTESHAVQSRYFHDKYGIPPGRTVFVYLGILSAGRGIETIVSAFADPDVDADVVFIGFGPLECKIREYASRYENVHFHEPVAHDKVVALVRNADFGLCLIENVSLSDYYCLPNKLFEYVFAGLSVLASKIPEIERVVTAYSLGQCCEPDVDSVREAISKLIARGPGKIDGSIAELSWSTQASRLSSAYQNLLQGRAG